jgi:hypothetical protein
LTALIAQINASIAAEQVLLVLCVRGFVKKKKLPTPTRKKHDV